MIFYAYKINKEVFIKVLTFAILSLSFFLNFYHLGQQGIFYNTYINLANSLTEKFSYTYHLDSFDTYPMWGYPILIAIIKLITGSYVNVFYFQYLLFVFSFILFFKSYNFSQNTLLKNVAIVLGFYFYAMVLSVKWPDAILAFCLFLTAYFHIKRKYMWASFSLAVAYNFRPEALAYFLVYIIYIIFKHKKYKVALPIFLILPWSIVNFIYHHKFIPTSTNGACVAYISLGQLPNNPWNLKHQDSFAYRLVNNKLFDMHLPALENTEFSEYVKEKNIKLVSPWYLEGNKICKEEFIKNIKEYPYAFIKKVFYNFVSIFKGGLYPGEIRSFFIVDTKVNKYYGKKINSNKSIEELTRFYKNNKRLFIKDLISFKKEAMVILFNWLIGKIGILVLFTLIFYTYKNHTFDNMPLVLILIIQIIVVSFIQYEPRHISKMIGILIFLASIKKGNEEISNI